MCRTLLPWLLRWPGPDVCRRGLLTFDFGDMMIGNEGTRLLLPLVRCRMVFRTRQRKVSRLTGNEALAVGL